MNKEKDAYKTIGEVAKIVGLIDKKKGTLSTHTIRYWEKEFRQIRPKIFSGRRRYYSNKTVDIIKLVKFLLKEKGMTIKGVKNALNNTDSINVDAHIKYGVDRTAQDKNLIKKKIKNISKIINELSKLKNG